MNAVVKPDQPQQKPLAPLEQIKRAMYPQIKALCPNDEKMANSIFATAVRLASDPKIMACTQASIINCFTRAIDLDLNLDPAYGEAYFIPYKDWREGSATELTLQLGAKGYAAMAQSLGGWQIQIIPVFDCDIYEVRNTFKNGWMDSETTLEFNQAERNLHVHDQAWCHEHLKAVIATARRKVNGEWVMDSLDPPITRNEIERRRLMSSNQKSYPKMHADKRARLEKGLPIGVWQEHYLAMAEKTALAAIARKLPKNKGTERLLDAISDLPNLMTDNQDRIHDIPKEKRSGLEQQSNENIEDADFTDAPPDNVDMETGEMPMTTAEVVDDVITKPLINFTEERYLIGAMKTCKSNNELVDFWETVPANLQEKYKEQFIECQDLMR